MITCAQWGARKPKSKPVIVRDSNKGILHHTDGHHPEIANPRDESTSEAISYAHEIQDLHMDDRGWNDSGHNFLIVRSGLILQGRWGTVSAIEHGRMVESAHCVGQNHNPGVEFEHVHGESMTLQQRASGVWLYAWIFDRCAIRSMELYGHRDFNATACPDDLYADIATMRLQITKMIVHYGRMRARKRGLLRAHRAVTRELKQ